MEDNENKKTIFLVKDDQKTGADAPLDGAKNRSEKLKSLSFLLLWAWCSLAVCTLFLNHHPTRKKLKILV